MNTSFSDKNIGTVRILSLGGTGNVTKNMYVYEYRNFKGELSDILIVDCGIGFPEDSMYGIDLIIPDISYLEDKKDKIRGIILTHGHEDHIGALPYILPHLNTQVFATKLTGAFAQEKLSEFGLHKKVNIMTTSDTLTLGNFVIEPVHVTHSIPDSTNLVINTPIGKFIHASDFKFDWTPLDGKRTDVQEIASLSKNGVLCLLSDCVRVESEGYTLSERMIEDTLEKEIRNCPGKFIFTTQSSNISRIQQAINVSIKHGRKISFLGRSIERNVEIAKRLKYLDFPEMFVVKEKEIKRHNNQGLSLIVTGSQAQPFSTLMRIADGSHKSISINKNDVVVFSADPIPGYENSVHSLIDLLTELGARVSYSDINDQLHVSGHGSKNDLALMIGLVKPGNLMPIGGTVRQMMQYKRLCLEMGYKENQVIIPKDGEIFEFKAGGQTNRIKKIPLKNIMVDGLGVGDIGNIVLRDRQTMANEGIVVAVISIEKNSGRLLRDPDIISRGFVYMKESSNLINKAKQVVRSSLNKKDHSAADSKTLKKDIEGKLEKFFFRETHRRPLVITVILSV